MLASRITLAAASLLCLATVHAQSPEETPLSSIVNERLSARRAAAAKSLADDTEPTQGARNLQRFYENLQRSKFGKVIDKGPIPRNKLEPLYLSSLASALTNKPFVWIDDRPLTRGEYATSVALMGYRKVGDVVQPLGYCSGTLIARFAVLTAAHCVCELGPNVTAFLGTEDFRKDAGVPVEVVASKARIDNCAAYLAADVAHQRQTLQGAGDVAVMFLGADAAKINIAPAIVSDDFKAQSSYYIVGYGISDDDPKPGVRRMATIQGIGCSDADSKKYGCNPAFEFWGDGRQITGRTDKPDSCAGDSGGSVYTTDKLAQPRLIAVISRPVTGTTCGQGGVYVRLTPPVLSWVEEQRKLASSTAPPA